MKVIVEKIDGISDNMSEKITKLARITELIIILGNKKDTDINKMYSIGLRQSGNVMLVENIQDLYLNYAKRFKVIGVIDTNLLPQNEVKEMIDILEKEEVKGYIYGRFK